MTNVYLIFKDKETLSRHIKRIHYKAESGKWKCDLCNKYFAQQGILSTHNKINSGIKLPCTECDKQFTRKEHLQKHLTTHGINQVKYTCELCRKQMHSKKSLRDHIRIHIGVKPFSCKVCLKEFSMKNSRETHMKSKHNGVNNAD